MSSLIKKPNHIVLDQVKGRKFPSSSTFSLLFSFYFLLVYYLGSDFCGPWPRSSKPRFFFFNSQWFWLVTLKEKKKIYFIFGCTRSLLLHVGFPWLQRAGASLHCGIQASHCGGFSCCGAQALGTRASVVVAHRFSCSGACGVFPWPEIKPMSPVRAGGSLSTVPSDQIRSAAQSCLTLCDPRVLSLIAMLSCCLVGKVEMHLHKFCQENNLPNI